MSIISDNVNFKQTAQKIFENPTKTVTLAKSSRVSEVSLNLASPDLVAAPWSILESRLFLEFLQIWRCEISGAERHSRSQRHSCERFGESFKNPLILISSFFPLNSISKTLFPFESVSITSTSTQGMITNFDDKSLRFSIFALSNYSTRDQTLLAKPDSEKNAFLSLSFCRNIRLLWPAITFYRSVYPALKGTHLCDNRL